MILSLSLKCFMLGRAAIAARASHAAGHDDGVYGDVDNTVLLAVGKHSLRSCALCWFVPLSLLVLTHAAGHDDGVYGYVATKNLARHRGPLSTPQAGER